MTERKQEPGEAEGTTAESNEWVSGEGGPNFTQGGMMPGGDEMQNWKQPLQETRGTEPTPEEQGENLRERLENE